MAIKTLKGCGVLKVDNDTIALDDETNVISVVNGVMTLPIATTSVLGGVKPDGETIEVDVDGAISVPIATNTVAGVVIPDGTIITVSETGAISVPDATDSVKGVVKQAKNQADSTATDVAGIVADFNTLLGKLKTAGIMLDD